MSLSSVILPPAESELARLVELMCDSAIAPAERDRLESLLTGDREAQLYYVAYLDLHAEMQWMMRDEGVEEKAESGSWKADQTNPPSPFPLPPSFTLSSFLPTTPLGNFAFSYAMSAVLVCIGLWIFSLMSASSPSNAIVKNNSTDANSRNSTTPNVPPPTLEPQIVSVARITGMVDCVWVNADDAPFHDRVVFGTKYMLASGLMEITYHTGAKVILQGPCTYTAESTAGGYLSLGKLTARVESRSRLPDGTSRSRLPSGTLPTDSDASKSRPAGGTYFAVRTPTATVTDLGTEFGVEVEKSGGTLSHVYRGKVELRVVVCDGKNNEQVIPLGENESARVALDNAKVVRIVRIKGAEPSNAFTRKMPKAVPIKLFNTGVGLKEGQSDPHWQLVARSDDPKFKPQAAAVISNFGSSWMANAPSRSQWIGFPGASAADGVVYTFRTTFELAGPWTGTAAVRGYFVSDNRVRAIRLNDRAVPLPAQTEDSYDFFNYFSIGRGFIQGTNVLEIEVENGTIKDGNPSAGTTVSPVGLRMELEGTVLQPVEASATTTDNASDGGKEGKPAKGS